jgi:Lrp/AsnC family leucine-responsive transcriptional regulator
MTPFPRNVLAFWMHFRFSVHSSRIYSGNHAMNDLLDRYDIRILQELQRDGRLTNNELSERIALSASQCSRRR